MRLGKRMLEYLREFTLQFVIPDLRLLSLQSLRREARASYCDKLLCPFHREQPGRPSWLQLEYVDFGLESHRMCS